MPEKRKITCSAEDLWKTHIETGEPLSEDEVTRVVATGLTNADDWEDRGGGLYWYNNKEAQDNANPRR